VLLDEPLTGLDRTTERAVLGALGDWCRDRTLVVATHRPAALELVDRIVVLEQGQVVLDGPRAAVLEQLARGITLPAGPTGAGAAAAPAGPAASQASGPVSGEALRVQG
jgi:ATP-binding cassette subfamily C protein LapB